MADDFSQIAKDFIDRANGGTGPTGTWRLEVLQKRFSPKAGREIPIRIRRFLKGIPWAQVHDAIRYLISQAPYEGIIYNGVELKGEYRPTLTQWRRDDQEQVGGNAQGSYTLIQDLIEVTDGDKLDTVSADSCSETEMTTWVWDAPEIEELPYDGSQGVTYAIRQVRRNEDGTFDYAIVRQVAKTKISGWKVTECDEYSTVRVRIFDNVYGGLYEGDPFTDGTTVLPIPAPCKTDNGTLVQVSVAQNPDCTFRVTVQETVANPNVGKTSETRKGLRGVVTSETTVATNPLPETGLELGEQVRNERRPDGLYDVTHVKVSKESVGDIGSSCETTVFEHRHVESENVASRPEKEASSASGGKTYQVQARATEEGTWDVTRTETTEIARTGAQKTKQKTLRGVTETTVDRNVDNDDVTVTNIGDRVSVEMTPGGKWNRTITKVSKESVGDIGSSCETTVFEHRHVESENVASRPEKEASSAGGGRTYQVQARATEEGTWDVTRTETTEIARTGAQKTKQKTLRGVTETTVDRNVDNDDVTVTNIGDRVSVEMTPGGKWNRTITKVSKESVGDIGSNCETTVFEHRHVESENVASRPGKEASSAGGGRTYQVQSRATEEGTWDVSRTTVTEQPVKTAQHMMRKTLRGITETIVSRNVNNSEVSVSKIGDEVRVERTPGGLWNRTETHASHEAVGVIGKSCSSTPVVHTDTVLSNVPDGSQPEPQHQSPEVNVERTVETRRTEEGTWDITKRTTKYQMDVQTLLAGNSSTTVDLEIGKNVPSVSSSRGGPNQDVSISASKNDHGSYDYQKRSTTYKPDVISGLRAGSMAAAVEIEIGKNVVAMPTSSTGMVNVETSISASKNDHGSYDYQKRTINYKPDRVTLLSGNAATSVDLEIGKNQPSVSAGRGGVNQDISISASKNDHGSYDYQKRTIVYKRAATRTISNWATEQVRVTTVINDTNMNRTVSDGEASSQPNDHGSASTRIVEYVAKPVDTGWITWSSTVKTPTSTLKYRHKIRVFKNLTQLPEAPGEGDMSLNVGINKFGLYDGSMHFSELLGWTRDTSGGTGGGIGPGGHAYGPTYVLNGVRWHSKYSTKTYWGSGHEGTLASAIANASKVTGGGGVTCVWTYESEEMVG